MRRGGVAVCGVVVLRCVVWWCCGVWCGGVKVCGVVVLRCAAWWCYGVGVVV